MWEESNKVRVRKRVLLRDSQWNLAQKHFFLWKWVCWHMNAIAHSCTHLCKITHQARPSHQRLWMLRKHLKGDTFCHSSFSVKLSCLVSWVHREDNMPGSNKRQAFPATTTRIAQKKRGSTRKRERKSYGGVKQHYSSYSKIRDIGSFPSLTISLSLSGAVCFSLLSTPSSTIDWLWRICQDSPIKAAANLTCLSFRWWKKKVTEERQHFVGG